MSDKKILPFVVATTIAGLLLLIPVALLGAVFFAAYDLMVELARTTGLDLPYNDFVDGLIIGAGALVSLIIVCFFIGLALRTSIGNALESRYDNLLQKYLPVVGMLRNLIMQVVGSNEDVLKLKPAEVALYGSNSRQYALVVEQLPDGRAVVFVPSVPAATLGQLHVVSMDDVTLLDVPVQDLLNAVTQWGAGSSLIYRAKS
ncbi:hypothetical protein GPB2148_760 [marine gamma proteobacterium HTCC2148]|jgi:uncharacterized membrane protein|uniref:DUF502 domain-containing protein n=1 Tax=Candidatus Seongchinamella marina TaxID=2518990 RepID=A0ABT3SVQ7_9GAMM|nr:hypothetical protein [Candidatus Seongchinamella marina]EEB78135.1 hypothetical protein GPB2148_760 [marine gamma proteobacterium HTCC2148]MBT3410836.1 hypothetical protein [Halieaceae bacterium]MBT6124656.1 hypothetical protein [Halieaceae bacterium]MCX2974083.1 hypothetical protein [Candidatus Seongchinamella marina]